MRKGFAAVIATAAMLGTVVCGSMVANAAEDMTFVIVPKCVHAWFDEVNKGAVAEAEVLSEQLGVEVKIDYRAPQTADVVEQNTTLEQAAATHPDGIALDPVDYEGSKAVIEEIQAQGIPVILFDAPSPEGSGLTSVGNDFAEQASLAAEKLVEILGEEGGKVLRDMKLILQFLQNIRRSKLSRAVSTMITSRQLSSRQQLLWQLTRI